MKPSSARIAASRGKALKLVLTARKRISAVAAWKATNSGVPSPKTAAATIATTVWPALLGRPDAEGVGDDRDPDEQHAEQDRHRQHRVGGVLRLGRLEGRDAVGDRLDAGQGHRAAREGPQERKMPRAWSGGRGTRFSGRSGRGGLRRCAILNSAHADHQQGQADEEVGRAREDEAGLAQAAQVRHRDEGDRQRSRSRSGCRTGPGRRSRPGRRPRPSTPRRS